MRAFFEPSESVANTLSVSQLQLIYLRIQSFKNQVTAKQAAIAKINITMIHKLFATSR